VLGEGAPLRVDQAGAIWEEHDWDRAAPIGGGGDDGGGFVVPFDVQEPVRDLVPRQEVLHLVGGR